MAKKPLSDESMLKGMLDALIPNDGTPGAMDAALHKTIILMIKKDPEKARFYADGLEGVRKEFGSPADWSKVLKSIESTYFFRIFRRDAMRAFYSDPISWEAIGYKGPPLIGYMDYHVCGSGNEDR